MDEFRARHDRLDPGRPVHGQRLGAAARGPAQQRQLADAMPQIVWTTDAEGSTLFYNERWYEFTGLDPATPGKSLSVIHPEDVPAMRARWEDSLASGDPFEGGEGRQLADHVRGVVHLPPQRPRGAAPAGHYLTSAAHITDREEVDGAL